MSAYKSLTADIKVLSVFKADAEHLEKLRQGPRGWDTYVKNQPPDFEANLLGAHLRKAVYDNKTVWPDGFDLESAGARNVDDELNQDGLDAESEGSEPLVVVELRRAAGLETVEQKQLALQGSESIIGELQKIVDDGLLSVESLASLQSEVDVLTSLRRNPLFDIQRFEQTLAKAAELIGDLDGLTKDTEVFLELVQGLGHPDPLIGGEQAGRVIEEATTPTTQTATIPDTENPDRKALLGKGIDKGIERLGEELVAEHFPDAVKSLGRAAGFGVKYGTAAVLVKFIVETLLAFLAAQTCLADLAVCVWSRGTSL